MIQLFRGGLIKVVLLVLEAVLLFVLPPPPLSPGEYWGNYTVIVNLTYAVPNNWISDQALQLLEEQIVDRIVNATQIPEARFRQSGAVVVYDDVVAEFGSGSGPAPPPAAPDADANASSASAYTLGELQSLEWTVDAPDGARRLDEAAPACDADPDAKVVTVSVVMETPYKSDVDALLEAVGTEAAASALVGTPVVEAQRCGTVSVEVRKPATLTLELKAPDGGADPPTVLIILLVLLGCCLCGCCIGVLCWLWHRRKKEEETQPLVRKDSAVASSAFNAEASYFRFTPQQMRAVQRKRARVNLRL